MWTSIRSRMGSALTVLVALLTMTLVVAAILFVVQRAFPAHGYQSYYLEVSPSAPWHPGQSLSLVWVPTGAGGGVVSDAPPHSVTCQFSLYGPYATQAEAQADHSPQEDGGTLAASAPPLALSTDLTAPPPPAVAYALPAALALGYYVAVGSTDLGDTGFASAWAPWVVAVTA